MNYHQYHPIDVVNGPGTRCTLFVSGCEHNCKGCYNQSTWSLRSGHPYTQDLENRIIADLNDTRIPKRGLSLSGGDPLHPQNVSAILHLVKRVKQECTDKDIWLWTGYLLSELSEAQKQVLEYIDVLIDGKFIKELADPSLDWRGSSNQVIHYLKS
ncbi:anaerobic ribonucleoside-triphosphate reductase-activating protein [Vibrio diazotrophicus]|uniref:Anaerobic ribonucleoside-triphosphate reductase-activating protein n=1 Tax=Vibrio diazotrophicus TaxID=685 RepID=A0ABX4W5T5_VIBDI|nr:anaerobic ribonucleoside-triphosphate reductase-activating protein [Vibrio diazotrophicus]MCZ4370271.1 anaerobic ribonucleoside-triphosphate reductase-activating protein [Vibrio diazotrophicus]PNH92242.1 anaerobic ribonucleotide reductase-activating protein [Vibrio diazotrophicus]PNH97580.1 anaerobic ribonucleotide reductase-activating protein [Vibrio diazotrophicus]